MLTMLLVAVLTALISVNGAVAALIPALWHAAGRAGSRTALPRRGGGGRPLHRQCSLRVGAHDLAVMGATLADGGVNGRTGQRVIDAAVCH